MTAPIDVDRATRSHQRPQGVGLIIAYKLLTAVAEFIVGALLWIIGSTALTKELNIAATIIRRHVAEAWSLALAERVIHAASARNLLVVVCALFLDGTLSFVESWALHRRYPWGRWLVVCATSVLLPVEFFALMHHLSAVRLAVLLVNSVIVMYLVPGGAAVERRRAKDSKRNWTGG
jgi:uncharacterized membrane protein (DUF2068 family)